MTAYIKLETLEYPRYEGDIRLEHPEITEDQTGDTFPCPDTYARVSERAPPEFDSATQTIYQIQPIFEDGVWHTVWEVHTFTPEELAEIEKNKPKQKQQDLSLPGSAPDVIG